MPEAARVRGYEPRPREPLPLRRRYVTGDALDERDSLDVAETGTHIKGFVATSVTKFYEAPRSSTWLKTSRVRVTPDGHARSKSATSALKDSAFSAASAAAKSAKR